MPTDPAAPMTARELYHTIKQTRDPAQCIEIIERALRPAPTADQPTARERAKKLPADLHPATAVALTLFTQALGEKLAAAQRKYGYSDGWTRPDWETECRAHLHEHIGKGDPRDVAAYCLFMWHHGWTTSEAEAKHRDNLARRMACGLISEWAGYAPTDENDPWFRREKWLVFEIERALTEHTAAVTAELAEAKAALQVENGLCYENYMRACRIGALLTASEKRAEAAERRMLNWRKAFMECTPGGSEYTTPEACRDHVREAKQSLQKLAMDSIREKKAAERRVAGAVAAERERKPEPNMNGAVADRLAWRVLALREAIYDALSCAGNHAAARQFLQNAMVVDDANASARATPAGQENTDASDH